MGDFGLLIWEMVLRHGVMRKCIKKLSENAKSFLAAYLRMKSPFRNPNYAIRNLYAVIYFCL